MSDEYTDYKAVAERIVNKWPNIGMECDEETLVKDISDSLHAHFHLGSAKKTHCNACTEALRKLDTRLNASRASSEDK